LLLAGNGLIRVAAAPLSGRLSDRIGTRLPATFGAAVLAFGAFLLSRLTTDSPVAGWVAGLLIAGCGIGMFVPPNNSMLMGAVPRSRHGIASGILATSRTVGMATGIALAGIVLSKALSQDANSQGARAAEAVVRAGHAGFSVAAAIALFAAVMCAAARPIGSRT
jgi:MFS family permease